MMKPEDHLAALQQQIAKSQRLHERWKKAYGRLHRQYLDLQREHEAVLVEYRELSNLMDIVDRRV